MFSNINALKFEECFSNWVNSFFDSVELCDDDVRHIAIDGKTLCSSYNKRKPKGGGKPLHLVSAWCSDDSLMLAQVKVSEKSNEIEAIPRLLNMIDVKDTVVSIDAMGCQKEIAANLVEQGAGYVLALKGNHPTLHNSVASIFDLAVERKYKNMHYLRKVEKVKDHGRFERRCYTLISCKENWTFDTTFYGMRSIGMVEVKRTVHGVVTKSKRYFITTLKYEDIDQFKKVARKHWDIEINLHWSLDVSFREDDNRTRIKNAAENLAIIRRMALNLLKRNKSTNIGISAKRKKAAWDNKFLINIIKNN